MITVTVTAVLMTIFLIVFSLATGVFSTFLLFWAHGGGWHPLRMARDIDDLRAVRRVQCLRRRRSGPGG